MTIGDTVGTEIAPPAKRKPVGATARGDMRVRRWAKSRRRLLVVLVLILSDILFALVVWQAALLVQKALGQGSLSEVAIASTLPYVAVWIGLRASFGLYPGYGLGQVEELRGQTFALLATLAITLILAFATQLGESLSRVLLFAWSIGLLLGAPVVRYFVKRAMMKVGLWGKAVVILGSRETGMRVLETLRREWQLGFNAVGVFDDRQAPIEGELEGVPYGASLMDAVALTQENGVDTAIFVMPQERREHLGALVNLASTSFRYVVVMAHLNGIANSAAVARDFAGDFGVEIKHNLLDPWARRLKSVLDLSATVLGALLISPLLIAIVVLIKLDSPGPVFYGHRRLGIGGSYFRCWKFRTRYTNAEQLLDEHLQSKPDLWAEWEQNFKLRNDPRVTRIGRFLRKTSLDELPQLWNVLRGEMSLVDPRPIVDAEVPKYGTVYEMYQRIRPGISGFWQVSGRSD